MSVEVRAPMPGKIVKILVNVGDLVGEDDELLILEAMKMENPIFSDGEGVVKEVKVKEGDAVKAEEVLLIIG